MKTIYMCVAMAIVSSAVSGCGWIHGLRREVEDDEDAGRKPSAQAELDYYKDPANRFVPPPPVNAADSRASALQGTAVDLSGVRAKNLRVTAKDFMAENMKNENSLWSEEGQNNYFFAQNKLKMPGDLVTVVIEDHLRKDMVDSVRKILPPEYRDMEIRVPGLTKDKDKDKAAGSAPAPRAPASGETPVAAAAEPGPDDILTAEVLERYPNGNLRLRGIKRVPFKTQVRNIEVVAIVKGADINEKDTVPSSRFFEQHVELYK